MEIKNTTFEVLGVMLDLPKSLQIDPLAPGIYTKPIIQSKDEFEEYKIPEDPSRTIFKWVRTLKFIYPPAEVHAFSIETIKKRTFPQKQQWFHQRLDKLRVPWQDGADYLIVSNANMLMSSKANFQNVNFHKEVKIKFLDDHDALDAGGLLRGWMTSCILRLFEYQTGLFTLCDTEETNYRFNVSTDSDVEIMALQYVETMGYIIGKSLFERMSMKCFLDKTILRQICSQPVCLSDFFSYDRQQYHSLKSILSAPKVQDLSLTFVANLTEQDGFIKEFPLCPNGRKVPVTEQNKVEFIKKLIEFKCCCRPKKLIDRLRASIYKVIPEQLLSIFEPEEFEMLLSGRRSISVEDWEHNTVFEGEVEDKIYLEQFWKLMKTFDANQLENVLHFVTGSLSLPIKGFKYLEGNRAQIKLFTIRMIPFQQNYMFLKAHTCFNRLQIPRYPDFTTLNRYLTLIADNFIQSFGIE